MLLVQQSVSTSGKGEATFMKFSPAHLLNPKHLLFWIKSPLQLSVFAASSKFHLWDAAKGRKKG